MEEDEGHDEVIVVEDEDQQINDEAVPLIRRLEDALTVELNSAVLSGGGLVPTLNREFRGAQQIGIFRALNKQIGKSPLNIGSLQTARRDEPTLAEGENMEDAPNDEQILEGLRHRLPQPLQPLGTSAFLTHFLSWIRRAFPRLLSRFPGAGGQIEGTLFNGRDPLEVMLEFLFELIIGLLRRRKARQVREAPRPRREERMGMIQIREEERRNRRGRGARLTRH